MHRARATVMSIDGISAYDLVSRKAMLQGLNDLTPSSYLWEDSTGRVHTILQGEGEQGDALMPLFFFPWPAFSLARVQSQVEKGEVLMAFLDDIYTVSMRVLEVHTLLAEALWTEDPSAPG